MFIAAHLLIAEFYLLKKASDPKMARIAAHVL